jgi:hypothetical protein
VKNQYFAQFYKLDLSGNLVEALGSDAVCSIDGRLSRQNMFWQASEHIERMQALNKRFTGFSVHYGTYSNNCVVLSYTAF